MSSVEFNPDDPPELELSTLLRDFAPVADIARALRKSPRTINRMIAKGTLPSVKIGRSRYVSIRHTRDALVAGHLMHGTHP